MFLRTMKAPSRSGMLVLVCVAALWAPASSNAATTIGSILSPSANTGVCSFFSFHADDRDCRDTQASLSGPYAAPGGVTSPIAGVIVGWTVKTGPPGGASSIKARLRVYRGSILAGGDAESVVALPLDQPGLHSFPTRLPIQAGDRLGLELLVTNVGVEPASVPIAHEGAGIGTVLEGGGAMADGGTDIFNERTDLELLLNAQVEPDADHDGFGDETQDRCPTSASTQSACPPAVPAADKTAPRTKLTYPSRQDFLAAKEVVVRLRSNEAATAIASGQLEIHDSHSVWGIFGDRHAVRAGKKVTLHLRVPRKARKAARAALANGNKVVVKVTTFARDAAGNESGKTIAVIKPLLPRRR